jgi:23S rRNA U2552 (ribose-2'-O)-methylase RlmE/FtsJ
MIEIVKQCKLFASFPSYRLPPSTLTSSDCGGGGGDESNRRDYHPPYHYHGSSYEYNTNHQNHQYHRSHSYGNGYNRYVYHDRSANRYTQKHYHQQPNGFYKHHPIIVTKEQQQEQEQEQQQEQEQEQEQQQKQELDESGIVVPVVADTEAGTRTQTSVSQGLAPAPAPESIVNENVNENINENENTDTGIRSFHLAEGPGGFIEAICYLRANANDVYYGMTLIDDTPNSACPGWKKSRLFLEKNPSVKLEYGKDGTGNLLSIDNYLHCCEKYRNSMDLITADGGFDFSSDFNHQEVLAQTLVVSEVLYALSLQKMGGSFVIKIFDTFTRVTVDIIHLLALFYTDVIIIKPNTSRVANSEKYIVCKGFKLPSNMDQVIETFSTFFKKLQSASAATTTATATTVSVGAILKSPELHKLHIVHRIEEVNAILGQQQIENIINTMGLVHGKSSDRIDAYKKSHIQKCIEWCERYNIPYNKQSMSTNTFISSVS